MQKITALALGYKAVYTHRMRKHIQSLSFTKACTGIIFFLAIDFISLALFESSVLATAAIAYGAYLTASSRIFPSLVAYIALLLVTFVKGGNCFVIGGRALFFWIIVAALRNYLRYSWPVRAIVIGIVLLFCEPFGWYLAKIVLNTLWVAAGIALFI